MPYEKLRNRWGIAVAAVVMQICLGAAYGWSVFKNPLMRTEHWTETSVQLNFTLAIAFLGLGTIIGGLWQDRVGPRRVATVAGLRCAKLRSSGSRAESESGRFRKVYACPLRPLSPSCPL